MLFFKFGRFFQCQNFALLAIGACDILVYEIVGMHTRRYSYVYFTVILCVSLHTYT